MSRDEVVSMSDRCQSVSHALQKETSQTLCSARAMLLDDIYVFKDLISDYFFLIADDVLISDVGLGRFGVMCGF